MYNENTIRIDDKGRIQRIHEGFHPGCISFSDPSTYKPYVYDQEQCDATFDCYVSLGRVHLAIMVGDESAGEIILKKINLEEKHCTMGVSMKNDSWKGMGYGTAAEIKALEYAFNMMN